MIPWRVKNFVSNHFPLLYHLAVNIGASGNSPQHWDRRLEETWDSPARQWPTKNTLIESFVSKEESVLDIGCGDGSILRYLKRQGFSDLHGLEISNYAITRLEREGIRMHRGSLPFIPLPNASFDVVIASQVLEHIIRRRRFLREIRRVLKPGGRCFVFVPDDCLGPISESEHVIKFNRQSLAKLLSRFFEIISLESIRDDNHEMPVLFARLVSHQAQRISKQI
jgi:ubiquinone/menaquinone biosynthesis C-methylase UbiE